MANAKREGRFIVSIEAPKESPQVMEILEGYQRQFLEWAELSFVATIIHDKDTTENGEMRRPHLHAFFELVQPMTQGQCLKWLETALKCDKMQLSLKGSSNAYLMVQYLVHKNHPAKAQYSTENVLSSNYEELMSRMNKNYEEPKNEEDLIFESMRKRTLYGDFVADVGIKNANKYRGSFNQIKQEQRLNYDALAKENQWLRAITKKLANCLMKFVVYSKKNALTEDDYLEAKDLIEELEHTDNIMF